MMDVEEVFSSDDSETSDSDHRASRLITEEDYLDMLFFSCDSEKSGKVDVSTLIEYLRFTTSSIHEGQRDIDELTNLLNCDNPNDSIDLESYREIITEWLTSVKNRQNRNSEEELIDATPTDCKATESRTSTPTKKKTPFLNMAAVDSFSLFGGGDGLLTESDTALVHRVQELQFQNKRLAEDNATLSSQLEAAEEANQGVTLQVEQLRKSVRSSQQAVEQVKQLAAENEELKGSLLAAEATQRRLEASLLQASRDNSILESKRSTLEEQICDLASKCRNLEDVKQCLQIAIADEKNEIEVLKQTIDAKDRELSESHQSLEDAKKLLDEVLKINERLKTERSELEVQLSDTREHLSEVCLLAELGTEEEIVADADESPLLPASGTPLLTATPIRTPSIATEIKRKVGNTPRMPMPLCTKELEEVFFQDDHSLSVDNDDVFLADSRLAPASCGSEDDDVDLDREVEAIMRATLRMDSLPSKVEKIAAEFEEKKLKVLEEVNTWTRKAAKTDTCPELTEVLRRKLQKELSAFASRLASFAAAKSSSDRKIVRLTEALKKLKECNENLEKKHQMAVQQLEASSQSLQGAMAERLHGLEEQLQEEIKGKLQLQEQLETLSRLVAQQRNNLEDQSATISDLLLHKVHLEDHIERLESANADLIEKYKKSQEQMNVLENDLEKKHQECSTEKIKTTELEDCLSALALQRQLDLKEVCRQLHMDVEPESFLESQRRLLAEFLEGFNSDETKKVDGDDESGERDSNYNRDSSGSSSSRSSSVICSMSERSEDDIVDNYEDEHTHLTDEEPLDIEDEPGKKFVKKCTWNEQSRAGISNELEDLDRHAQLGVDQTLMNSLSARRRDDSVNVQLLTSIPPSQLANKTNCCRTVHVQQPTGGSSNSEEVVPSTSAVSNRTYSCVETKKAMGEHQCPHCKKMYKYRANAIKHAVQCESKKRVTCEVCKRRFQTPELKQQHIQKFHKKKLKSFRCRKCNELFGTRNELYDHDGEQHGAGEREDQLQSPPWEQDDEPWNVNVGEMGTRLERTKEFQRIYNINKKHILANHRMGNISATYNFPTDNLADGGEEFTRHMDEIFNNERRAYKLNVGFGVIIRHVETHRLRYFVPYKNSNVLEEPALISTHGDVKEVVERLKRVDVGNYFTETRPDTKWVLEGVVNVTYFVSRLDFPLGRGFLPMFVKGKRSIVALDQHCDGSQITDMLCIFRCLALYEGKRVEDDLAVISYYDRWRVFLASKRGITLPMDAMKYEGIGMSEMPDFEECFEISVYVYELTRQGTVIMHYKPFHKSEKTIFMNIYDGHLSYVSDFKSYARKFECVMCRKCFNKKFNIERHMKSCPMRTKYVFKGGYYSNPQTVFEELEVVGIHVPERDRLYKDFAVFDCEAMLRAMGEGENPKLKWLQKHEVISVAVNSNVSGFDSPECFISEDIDILVDRMVSYLEKIQQEVVNKLKSKWNWVLEELVRLKKKYACINEDLEQRESRNSNSAAADDESSFSAEDVEDDGADVGSDADSDTGCDGDNGGRSQTSQRDNAYKRSLSLLQRVEGRFIDYISTLPVIGYNSAKYDFNLLKSSLMKRLKRDGNELFVIKKENTYITVDNKILKFLDITQYLTPGVSYSKFLKAYGVEEQKGVFCYEYLDCPEKLNETSLPPHEAFYSSLKGRNITLDEYQDLQRTWLREGMSTLRDLLSFYNKLDVGPFVEGVINLQKFYFDRGMDVFKVAVSAPGIARRLLFQAAAANKARFPTFGSADEDMYQTFKKNIVGGPAIVFTRTHEIGETRIRDTQSVCKSILGLDANSLYLCCIGKKHMTGSYVRRKSKTGFVKEKATVSAMSVVWLEWEAQQRREKIVHAHNRYEGEVWVGPYRVDGLAHETGTVFEFNGCFYHGHQCLEGKMNEQERMKREKRTKERRLFIEEQGYKVVSMEECMFERELKTNADLSKFAEKFTSEFSKEHKGRVSERQILDGVLNETLFGAVEVDISVPDDWPVGKEMKKNMTPKEYFSEMCPLFGNALVELNQIGEHMKEHVKTHKLSDKPRRLLVGVMEAKKMLIMTPLLKWYMEHGLVVTRVYQSIEFLSQSCFKTFVDDVTEARRQGDRNSDMSIIADTMKLIGNSAYGGIIMQKEKQHCVKYYTSAAQATAAVNSPRFRRMTEMQGLYEVEMSKNRIVLDMPVYVGFSILQYAKLVMLSFYYDCIDRWIDRSSFEYVTMDTDSAYIALSKETLTETMTDEGRQLYTTDTLLKCDDTMQPDWFMRECCERHHSFDRRLPGIMKEEAKGTKIVALTSKTYILENSDTSPSTVKFSCKGITKSHVENPVQTYTSVLQTGQSKTGLNKGFRAWLGTMCTYELVREGFTYFYAKRQVMRDGVHTLPLTITLCPWGNLQYEYYLISRPWHVLSPRHERLIGGGKFVSIEHMFVYKMAVHHRAEGLAQAIQSTTDRTEFMSYANMVTQTKDWKENHRFRVMTEVMWEKTKEMTQIVKRELNHTKRIVYACSDKYWGIGMNESMAEISTEEEFRGMNKLGEIWENIRVDLFD